MFYHSVLFCNDIVELKSYLLNIENKNLTKSSIATQWKTVLQGLTLFFHIYFLYCELCFIFKANIFLYGNIFKSFFFILSVVREGVCWMVMNKINPCRDLEEMKWCSHIYLSYSKKYLNWILAIRNIWKQCCLVSENLFPSSRCIGWPAFI